MEQGANQRRFGANGSMSALGKRQPGPLPHHGVDKTIAGIGMTLPTRFQHVTQQEPAGELKAVLQILLRPAIVEVSASVFPLPQERRQPQQFIAPGFTEAETSTMAG